MMFSRWIAPLMLIVALTANAAEYKAPVLLTSGGQSADVQMLKTLLSREGIPFTLEALATSANLENHGSVIIVLGGSSKGLGAAKVSSEQETARITELLTAANERKLPVLAVHVGGKNRRGALSDAFNRLGASLASELIVVTGGDDDGFFKQIADERKIGLIPAAKITDIGPLLKERFKTAEPNQE